MKCLSCRNEDIATKMIPVTLEVGPTVIVVEDVPFRVC